MNKRIANTIYWALFLFVILVALIPTLSTVGVEIPFKLYAVQTGSMAPTIKVGDLIFVKEQENYKVDDIVTFQGGRGESETTITHRIIGVDEDGVFTTKGDFNTATDIDKVPEENIVGKYVFRIPFLGYPVNFVRTPIGFLILIVIPAVIISYEEFNKIKREISNRRKIDLGSIKSQE